MSCAPRWKPPRPRSARQRRGRGLGARAQDRCRPPGRSRAFDGGQPGRPCRRVRVRPDDPRWPAAVRRRDLGRRAADASPARHPARLHAPAARRRARVGRADRGALGLRGVDLRPLRLRARGAGCRSRSRIRRASRSGRQGGERRDQAGRRRRGDCGSSRRSTRRIRAHARRDAVARRALVEGATARGPEEPGGAGRAGSSTPSPSRGGRRRGLRDVPGQGRVGGRLRDAATCG